MIEISHEDLRCLTDAIVEQGAPATAIHAREVVLNVHRWAIERGQKVDSSPEVVRPTAIAKFLPRDKALTRAEINLVYKYMNRIGASPQYRTTIKLLMFALVRKSKISNVTYYEDNFSKALWVSRKNP